MKIVFDMQGAQVNAQGSLVGSYTAALIRALSKYNSVDIDLHLAFSGQLKTECSDIIGEIRGVVRPRNISWWYAPTSAAKKDCNNDDLERIANEIYSKHLLSLQPDVIIVADCLSRKHHTEIARPSDQLLSQVPIAYLLDNPAPWPQDNVFADHQERLSAYLEAAGRLTNLAPFSISELIKSNYTQTTVRVTHQQVVKNIDLIATRKIRSAYQGSQEKRIILFGTSQDCTSLDWALRAFRLLPARIRRKLHISLCTPTQNTLTTRKLATISGLRLNHIGVHADCDRSKLHELYAQSHALMILENDADCNRPAIIDALDFDVICVGPPDSGILDITGCMESLIHRDNPRSISFIIEAICSDPSYYPQILEEQQAYSRRSSQIRLARATLKHLSELIAHFDQTTEKISFSHYTASSAARDICRLSATRSADTNALSNCIAHSFARSSFKKCLFIDISSLVKTDHKTGIQRVVRATLKNLIHATPCDWEIIAVYADEQRKGYFVDGEISGFIEGFNLSQQTAGKPAAFRSGDILLVLDLDHGTALYQEDFLLLIRSRGVSVYFVVYDILPILMPQCFPNGTTLNVIHSRWLRLIARMDGYLAISESVRNELEQWYRDDGIVLPDWYYQGFFHLGADLDGSIPSKGMPDNYREILDILRQRPSFLQVSTIEPRKGYEQILNAFDLLWMGGHEINLVFVGKQGWLVDDLIKRIKEHSELGHRLIWLQGISDEMLDHVYSASTCCIMASYGEGFGLPLVEAAQKGLPIIARNIPVFKEIAGNHACFFDANTADGLADTIRHWLDQYTRSNHIESKGLPWLSWRESAKQVMEGLLTAYAENPRISSN